MTSCVLLSNSCSVSGRAKAGALAPTRRGVPASVAVHINRNEIGVRNRATQRFVSIAALALLPMAFVIGLAFDAARLGAVAASAQSAVERAVYAAMREHEGTRVKAARAVFAEESAKRDLSVVDVRFGETAGGDVMGQATFNMAPQVLSAFRPAVRVTQVASALARPSISPQAVKSAPTSPFVIMAMADRTR